MTVAIEFLNVIVNPSLRLGCSRVPAQKRSTYWGYGVALLMGDSSFFIAHHPMGLAYHKSEGKDKTP